MQGLRSNLSDPPIVKIQDVNKPKTTKNKVADTFSGMYSRLGHHTTIYFEPISKIAGKEDKIKAD